MEPKKKNINVHTQYWGTNNSNIYINNERILRLPNLPYSYSALENISDAQNFKDHFQNFHVKSYEDIQRLVNYSQVEKLEIEEIFKNEDDYEKQMIEIAGTIYNHQLFWDNLSPYGGEVSDALKQKIDHSFGSIFQMKEQFIVTGMNQECCGWLWLITNKNKQLEFVTTKMNKNPLMPSAKVKGKPLLAIDLWEHAFSSKFPNHKELYLKNIWMYINWTEVSTRLSNL